MTQEFKDLARYAAHKTAPANFDLANVDEAFRGELSKYCSSIPQFMKNRWDLYEIIAENADEIVPNKVINYVGIFAEVKQVPQNTKALFRTPIKGKNRAKKFLTQVGLSGVYEAFRLDRDEFEVAAHAMGGAVTIDFERMLDGAENLADVMDVLTEGLTDGVFVEIQKALKAAVTQVGVPAANRVVGNYDGDKLFKLCATVSAYGSPVIFAPPEFIAAMGADAIVPVGTNYQGIYHPQDIDAIHNTGYVNLFRGTPIVKIPQSFIDENNDKTWIDPQLAYILPAGKEKVVKVVFEGKTVMYDRQNRDNSMEINVYKKLGVAIMTYHNWAIYQNSAISQTMYNPYVNL